MRFARHAGWVVANLVVVGTAGFALVASRVAPDVFYFISQEDHWVEWSTVWAFALAALAYVMAARSYVRVRQRLPWFYIGLTVFCLVITMEELSWGQRLLSYRPPGYFLEANFQQELNFHNVIDSSWRKLALQAVILGYGVCFPLSTLLPTLRRGWDRLGIASPPPELLPAFAATSVFYFFYPLSFTGEWVELMLGLCMLFAAASAAAGLRADLHHGGVISAMRRYAIPATAAMVLGFGSLWLTSLIHAGAPATIARARADIEALIGDFQNERVATRCGVHKRIYTFVREYGQQYLHQGVFANQPADDHDDLRRVYFLDPWNMPYWVRHRCSNQRSREFVYVYSFGPNRRRDSIPWDIRTDDIGGVVMRKE